MEENGLKREDLFVTTKIWMDHHSYEGAQQACDESLKKLGLDYVDLYLIHWPKSKLIQGSWEDAEHEVWRGFEKLYQDGKVRAIGVCNHTPEHLKVLMSGAKVMPMVNQIELHPGLDQAETRAFCKENNIVVEGWSPLGCGQMFQVETMKTMAQKYNRSIAQICLRWALQNDILPLPKSVTPSRIVENTKIFDFEISADDMAALSTLSEIGRTGPDPDNFPM